jgi:hypothetical protein
MLVGFRKPKAAHSPLYADYRPKTNAAILWDMGHNKDDYTGPVTNVALQGKRNFANLIRIRILREKSLLCIS